MHFQVNRLLNALKNCTASMTLSVRQEIASYFVPELEAFVDLVNELGRYSDSISFTKSVFTLESLCGNTT